MNKSVNQPGTRCETGVFVKIGVTKADASRLRIIVEVAQCVAELLKVFGIIEKIPRLPVTLRQEQPDLIHIEASIPQQKIPAVIEVISAATVATIITTLIAGGAVGFSIAKALE